MITVLLLTANETLNERLRRALPDASLFCAESEDEAIRQLQQIDIDLVVWSAAAQRRVSADFAGKTRAAAPSCVTIAVGAETLDIADFVLPDDHGDHQLKTVLDRALERRGVLQELADLRERAAVDVARRPAPPSDPSPSAAMSDSARLLREFTRILAAGFDLPRMLDTFVAGVVELVRPARLALLLPETDGRMYRVNVSRGLTPQIVSSIRLPADRGLCRWLALEGRPVHRDVGDPHVARELTLLQGTIGIPLIARGQLVAVLVIGQPLVRNGYSTHELETLFDLGTHLATAINDITLHHRLQRANEFNKLILEHLSSGVITIGSDQAISTVNRRASEVLGVPATSLVGSDLRVLPSPLGDMLYETLVAARALPRTEIRLAARGLWLEVSTYPVHDQDAAGAVLVLEDVTAQKELAAQKLQAEQFDLLTRVVARIADEIKNPLVSINTFMELIGERFDDPDFRQQFSSVVGRDVRRLVQVLEKLTGLVSQGELNFSTVDVHTVVDEAVATVQVGDDATRRPIEVHVTREPAPLRVKVDSRQLHKALCYLVWYLGYHSSERAVVSVAVGRHAEDDGPDDVRVVVASRTAAVPARELDRMFDPVRMVQESLIDIGPAVSQRIVEALGGRLTLRHGRHDIAFVMRLPAAV